MNASDRFKPVLKVAANREASAARKFGQSRRQQLQEEQKLSELRDYHAEYLHRFRESASIGISASQLLEYQAFLKKLETAITEQEEAVRRSRVNCQQHKQRWTEKHIRTQSMDAALERLRASEARERESLDQKLSDEVAQRISRRSH